MAKLSTSFILRRAAVDGTSITVDEAKSYVQYAVSTSATTPPTSGWQDTVPTIPDGSYLWSKTVVYYSDGSHTTAYGVSSRGSQGEGVTITSKSVTYAVSTTADQPADSEFKYTSVPSVAQGDYLWSKTTIVYSTGDTTTAYSVSRIGADGETVVGHSSYLHLAYATSADGKEGFSLTYFAGATYLGTLVDDKSEDSTTYSDYTWVRIKGEQGNDGDSAWSVRLTPSVLSFKANASGQLIDDDNNIITGKTATVAVYYGDTLATTTALSVGSSLVGCTASKTGVKSVTINPALSEIEGVSNKYVPATAGSATFKVSAKYGTHTLTDFEFSVQFTCDVCTQFSEQIISDTEITNRVTAIESTTDGLSTSVSEISQHADEIALMVKQATEKNNLIPNSWLNMVSNDYGGTCKRAVQLTKGTTYILSVEGRIITSSAILRAYIYNAGWSEQAHVDITSTSLTTAMLTFTSKATGTYYIGFYNYSKTGYKYYIHVYRAKLEVAQKAGDTYIATSWTESKEDGANANLIKKIVFPDTESTADKDGLPVTAYKVYSNDSTADYVDGGIANYPAGASSELTKLAAGETYTLSFFAKASTACTIETFLYGTTSAGSTTVCQGAINSDTSATPKTSGDGYWKTSLGTEWQKVSITFTTKTELPAGYQLLVCRAATGVTILLTDVRLEKGGRYTSSALTGDDLLPTGIDIKKGIIELTADNFRVKNNAGEQTASIDADGNLTVPTLRTENKSDSNGYMVGNVVIHKNLIELFGGNFKVMEMGVEGDAGFIHFFNASGRLVWGVEDGGQIDYTSGVIVKITSLQYLPECFADGSKRLTTLMNATTATLTAEEHAAMMEMTAAGETENFARYYAPHESATSDTVVKDEKNDLSADQAAAYDQRVFKDGIISDTNLITTVLGLSSDSDLWSLLRFDISPLIQNKSDGSIVYVWTIYKIYASGSSKNTMGIVKTFSYTITAS